MEMKSTWPFCGVLRSVDRLWGPISFSLYGIKITRGVQDHPGSSATCRVHGIRKIKESPWCRIVSENNFFFLQNLCFRDERNELPTIIRNNNRLGCFVCPRSADPHDPREKKFSLGLDQHMLGKVYPLNKRLWRRIKFAIDSLGSCEQAHICSFWTVET